MRFLSNGNKRCLTAFVVAAIASLCGSARGDVFLLESGGQIQGEWLNRDEQPLTKYQVRRGSVTFSLPVGQVREAIRQQPAELEYAAGRRWRRIRSRASGNWPSGAGRVR